MSESSAATSPFIDRFEARAFSRATEVIERVKRALFNTIPEDVHEHVVFTKETTEGHHKTPIHILSIELGETHAEQVAHHIFSKLSKDDNEKIFRTIEQRLDEDCTFFLRIDKQAAYLGYIELAKVPDVISCQLHIMKYPKCRQEDAKNLLEAYTSNTGVHSE